MTERLEGLRDDVAFMRALAEESRNAPLLGGSISVAAGLCFGAASLLHYGALKGWFSGSVQGAVNWAWLVSAAVFGVALAIIVRRTNHAPGASTTANKINDTAWTSAGLAVFAIFGGFILASARTGEWIIMAMLPPVILALYGAAWAVASAAARQGWMRWVAAGSMLLSVATAWLAGTAEQYLLYTGALFLLALLPGLVMMRQARRAD